MKKRNVFVRAITVLGLILAVALVVAPAVGAADNALTIKTMKLSVWPEYDDSRILVTYQGEFNNGSTFPQPVQFPVQLGSEINQVCALKPPQNDHLCQLYNLVNGTDSLNVSYTLPIPTYYLEYYWDGIKGQPDRSFTFKYVSPYAVDSLELDVQQPLRATAFKLSQPYASISTDGLGMKYYHYVFNNVTPGQVISVDASYSKPDNKPSVAKSKTSTGAAGASAGGTAAGGSNAYVAMGIIAAVIVVAVVGLMVLRRKRVAPARGRPVQSKKAARIEARRMEAQSQAQAQSARRQGASRPSRPEPARAAPPVNPVQQSRAAASFCSQCGTKLASGSRFCHVCGAKAEGEE